MKIPCPYCGADITYEVYSKNIICTTCTGVSSIKDINLASFYKNDNCLNTYLCEMCGAELVVDNHSIVTKCAFCNSQHVIPQKLKGSYRPDYIIPFSIDKKAFKEKYLEEINKLRFLPKEFKDIENVTSANAVYVPYFAINADTEMIFDGADKMPYSRNKLMIISDASKRLNDDITSSVCPYFFSKSDYEKFNPIYLLGFQAEFLDLSLKDLESKFAEKGFMYGVKILNKYYIDSFPKYKFDYNIKYDAKEAKLFLLPVFYSEVKYKKKLYQIAMNGINGNLVGNFPVDWKRVIFIKFVLLAIGVILIWLSEPSLNNLTPLWFVGSVFVFASIVWNIGLTKKHRKIHKNPESEIIPLDGRRENFNLDFLRFPLKNSIQVNDTQLDKTAVKKIVKENKKAFRRTHGAFYY